MKRIVVLCAFALVMTAVGWSQVRCTACGGTGHIPCFKCKGNGKVIDYLEYDNLLITKCQECNGVGTFACIVCRETGRINPAEPPHDNVTSWFKQTTKKCKKCKGCTGYWGIFHHNNTYEGPCTNITPDGTPCGHGPKKHGLPEWK